LILAFFLISCEQVVELGTLPYEEKLVVRAVLTPDDPLLQLYFTRTFSLDELYTPEKAAVRNVTGTISENGLSYPLGYAGNLVRGNVSTGFAIYEVPGLVIQPGKTYTLTAAWNGHQLRASTRVPDAATIDTAYLQKDSSSTGISFFVRTEWRSQRGTVYSTDYEILGITFPSSGSYSTGVIKPGAAGEKVATSVYVGSMYSPRWKDSLFTIVMGFDEPFYEYYRSRRNSRPSTGGFSFLGGFPGPVFWNVEGEALGMFIGMTMTKKKVFVP